MTAPGLTIAAIQATVAEYFGVTVVDMRSAARPQVIAKPRQAAMYLATRMTARTLPEIGRMFGGRDHTTVIHARDSMAALRRSNREWRQDLDWLEAALRGEPGAEAVR